MLASCPISDHLKDKSKIDQLHRLYLAVAEAGVLRKYHRGAIFALGGQCGLFRHLEICYATKAEKGGVRSAVGRRVH